MRLECTSFYFPFSISQEVAHVAQSVERILGKDEVHRFDPGRGLHQFSVIHRRGEPVPDGAPGTLG